MVLGKLFANAASHFLQDDSMIDIRVKLKAYSMGRQAHFEMNQNAKTEDEERIDDSEKCIQPVISKVTSEICSACTVCPEATEIPECCDSCCSAEPLSPDPDDGKCDANASVIEKFNRVKKHSDKQEKWLLSRLRKKRETCEKDSMGIPTTHVIARFAPKGTPMPVPDSRYVEIDFSYNKNTNADVFKTKGYLEFLLPAAGEDSGETLLDDRIYVPAVDIFFQNFPYFVNNLEGIVWWNGFNISASGYSETRLQLVDFDFEPSQVVISMDGIKDLHVLRSALTLELRAEDLNGNLKWFRIKGRDVASLKASGPKDGVVKIEFPEYCP